MKLLTKQDIQQHKARERLQEIQEGKKLASTVDALRQVKADEEKALQLFRVQTLSEINEEIQKESQKLVQLKEEVTVYEARKTKALRPLVEEEKRIAQKKEELGKRQAVITETESSLTEKEKLQKKLQKEIEEEKQRIETERQRSIKTLEEAERMKGEAVQSLTEAKKTEALHLSLKEQTEKELKERLDAISIREKNNTTRENSLTRREIEHNRREIYLLHREEMLTRTLKRKK